MRTELWKIVRRKFGTDVAFGMALGWVPQRVSKLRNGKYEPKIGEAATMSRVLGVSLEAIADCFKH